MRVIDYSFPTDRVPVIPFRNSACGGNVRQKGTKVPSDRQESGTQRGNRRGENPFLWIVPSRRREGEIASRVGIVDDPFSFPGRSFFFGIPYRWGERKREFDAFSIKKRFCFQRTNEIFLRCEFFPSIFRKYLIFFFPDSKYLSDDFLTSFRWSW